MGKSSYIDLALEKIQSQWKGSGFKKFSDFIRGEYKKETDRVPRIAIIGAAGVGKTSTINALFGTNLRVSHTVAGTKKPARIDVRKKGRRISGTKGDLILYDMPGIDEDIDIDEEYRGIYRQVISKCDVAVWVVSAPDRRMKSDQEFIRDVVTTANSELAERLVIGVNKVDKVNPENWDYKVNVPSAEQVIHTASILENVKNKFSKVVPGLTKDRVIGYSATQRYHLQELFGAMLKASPPNRAWLLHSMSDIANYLELVSPDVRHQSQLFSGD